MSLTLKFLILFLAVLGFLVYWFKKDPKRLYTFGNILKNFFLPEDLTASPDAFTKMQLKALADKRTISRLLFYRSFMKDEDSDLAFFKMHDGRAGIVYKVEAPVYLTEKSETAVLNILSAIVSDDTIIHISTLAGRDIKDKLENFKQNRNHSKLNLKNVNVLKTIFDRKIASFQDWVTQSIMGKESDMRVRNFTHTISVLFPVGLEKNKITKQSNEIYGILKESFGATIMNDNELVSFCKEILNPSVMYYPKEDDPITTISKRMTKGAEVNIDNEDGTILLRDGWMAKVLSTEKYPKEVDAFSHQNIFFDTLGNDYQMKLPCPFFLSLTIKFSDVERQRKKVLEKARWNVGQLAPFTASTIEKRFPELKERRKESEDVIQYLEYLGEIPIEAGWNLTLFENDKNRLEQYSSLIRSSFDSYPGRWVVREEKYANIAFYSLLMGLPLNYSEAMHSILDKFDKNFKSNNAQIAPLIGGFKGMGDNPSHLYIDRTGQLVEIDIFASKENYNIVVVGPMGTGKSFWTNNFLMSGLDKGWQVRIIDFGRSYLKSNQVVGGEFLEFTKKAKICLNFFTHLQTVTMVKDDKEIKIIDPDELESIVPIVGLMMGVGLKEIYKSEDASSSEKLELSVMSSFIIDAVNKVFKRHGHEGGMREIGEVLDEMRREKLEENNNIVNDESELLAKMYTSLKSYTQEDGVFYKYFNGANNINLDSSFFVLELDDIATSPMMPVVAMSFLQRTAQEAYIKYLDDMTTSRIVGVDEAHKILGNAIFAKFFDDFGRRIRKYRGVPILVTQSIEDFNVNKGARAFFELASWKILLKQKPESVEMAIKNKMLILNRFKKDIINSVKLKAPHYNEFALIHGDLYTVAILKVNADEYWTYSTNPHDRAKLDTLMKEKELNLGDAIWVMARKQEGMSTDKALYEVSKKNSETGSKDWDKFFKRIIENDEVHIAKQDVVYKRDNIEKVEYQELFMRVKDKNGVLHNPGVFMIAAHEKGYATEISKIFLNKVVSYIKKYDEDKNVKFSINIDSYDIADSEYIEHLFLSIKKLGDKKDRLFFEIELDVEAKENSKKLLEFAKRVKANGIDIAFDNIVMENMDLATFINIEPKYLKISSKVIENISSEESDFSKKLFNSLIDIADIKIIATKIENEEDMSRARLFNIHRFQGYKINKTINL